jgi:hypothetical protein
MNSQLMWAKTVAASSFTNDLLGMKISLLGDSRNEILWM